LNRNDVHGGEATLPADPREQNSIAAVLTDMDNEIDALEGKLVKARAVKQGMMQVLLTGEVRLV
jgi:type I restriction enzyme, S subunit